MLINITPLFGRLGLNSGCVVHVGAHEAEELGLYLKLNLSPRIWIEAQPRLASLLVDRLRPPHDLVLQGAAWSERGIPFQFKISNNSQSSSVLDFGTHAINYPDVTTIETVEVHSVVLEDVLSGLKDVTLLNLDIQGAELQALKGAAKELEKVKAIYTEVNFEEVYKECAVIGELDEYLMQFGFKRVLTIRTRAGWGDALYLKKEISTHLSPLFWLQKCKLGMHSLIAQIYSRLRSYLISTRNL